MSVYYNEHFIVLHALYSTFTFFGYFNMTVPTVINTCWTVGQYYVIVTLSTTLPGNTSFL